MAISAKAPKDFAKISNKTKVALNLTKRQLICFGAAAFVGVPLYIATKGFLGTDISAILMILVMIPLFLLAMYEKDGKPAEKVLGTILRQRYILPGIRRYKSENLYGKMEEKRWNKIVNRLYSRMYLHEWKKNYKDPDICVMDGTYWSLKIKLSGKRERNYHGSNCYPSYWKELKDLFRPFMRG